MIVTLGALLGDTPHSRPIKCTGSATDEVLAARLGMQRSRYEGPTGIVGVTVAEKSHSWRADPWNVGNAALQSGEVLELFVFGTAVVPTAAPSHTGHAAMVVCVNEPEAKKAEAEE